MDIIGLSAEQAEQSKAKHGDNRLTEQKRESFWQKLWANFGDPMIRILCVALVINLVFTFMGQTEWYESAGIALAVILATLVSTFSEYRNENAFQKLQEEASRIFCKVYRDTQLQEISILDIVVGDFVLLQTGDKIPADGILVDGWVKVDQSALNGESEEAKKEPLPSGAAEGAEMDFLNPHQLFRGSVVLSGNAVMRVRLVGDRSVYGQIASELQHEDERDSPLKVKLSKLARDISKFGYIGGVSIAVVLLFQRVVVDNAFDPQLILAFCSNWMLLLDALVDALMLAVIIIVMAVPEGLPLMIALVSAMNMGKMLKANVLVRKVSGIETAGSLNILFSDKTGTITKGQLEAVTFLDGAACEYETMAAVPGELSALLALSIFGNTSAVLSGSGAERKILGGNATERAILRFAAGSAQAQGLQSSTISSIPFHSANKYSAASVTGDYSLTLIKGAPEQLLDRCESCYNAAGEPVPLTGRAQLDEALAALAARAIRVVALATAQEPISGDKLPAGAWTLVGVLGIRDDLRPESVEAIAEVQRAGVQVVMITGDLKDTAVAVAAEAGILTGAEDIVLTSAELQSLGDEALKEQLPNIKVIARALPSDKSRLVRLAQECGLVVGMTGDGVNDSPALQKADVGFAMGSGTEVAKEASGIVILDDNFSSIDQAILYGRTIFNNIRKFIIFQLTINVSAVLISFLFPLLGMEHPLSITQILWINLVMDTLAALAFGGEPALRRYMNERPKRRDEHIISRAMWGEILTASVWLLSLSLLLLLTELGSNCFRADADNRFLLTGFFCFFILAAVFNAFNARTERVNLLENIRQNHAFWQVLLLIVAVQVAMAYLGGDILRCYGLLPREWLLISLMALTMIPMDLLRKAIVAARAKRQRA